MTRLPPAASCGRRLALAFLYAAIVLTATLRSVPGDEEDDLDQLPVAANVLPFDAGASPDGRAHMVKQ